jgi:hypothetical protein
MHDSTSFLSWTHSRMIIYIRVLGLMSPLLSLRDGAVMHDLPEQVSTCYRLVI